MEINCYQGVRHRKGLPVHGQRTHTNARTRKGPKKTVAGKKEGPQVDGQAHRKDHSAPASSGAQERRLRRRAHQELLQQHDRLDRRPEGNVLAWASAGNVGFKGSRKSPPSPPSWPPKPVPAVR